MANWRNYKEGRQHTVQGNLLITDNVYSPELNNARDILVWLPYSYDGKRHYPVVYMHDGYNLFDAHTSFVGEWQVDETMTQLAEEGLEAIIVGIPNNEERMKEYSPFPDSRFGMKSSNGDAYLRYIIDVVKPMIDQDFKTLPNATHTGMMGSSMGGLISLYAGLAYGHVFGFVGVMSPSFWFGQGRIQDTIQTLKFPTGRIYMDIGAKEGRYGTRYMSGVKKLADALREKGYGDEWLLYVEDPQGKHDETTWARRLPNAIRFLLAPFREQVR
jgi:predicted alpha/beta superfamily hydrolase